MFAQTAVSTSPATPQNTDIVISPCLIINSGGSDQRIKLTRGSGLSRLDDGKTALLEVSVRN